MKTFRESWCQLKINDKGMPDVVLSDDFNRTQREIANKFRSKIDLADLEKIEKELDGALTGIPIHGGYCYCGNGGSWNLDFDFHGKLQIVFEYDPEKDGSDRYARNSPEGKFYLEMPLSDFEIFFRQWVASVRWWRAKGGEWGVKLPADKWPKCYPPELDV